MDRNHLVQIFKAEYSNLIAVLCQFYGVTEVQLAEDIVSETFYKAMKSWSHKGVPDSPKSWLRTVAVNKLKDHFKRDQLFRDKITPSLQYHLGEGEEVVISDDVIEDSQLKMIFVVCNPQISDKAQICLALRILCGFNIEEIAMALMSNKASINKVIYRAKKSISEAGELKTELEDKDYNARLETVLRIIYLLFNEGYYSSIQEDNIREDICWEAMRLAILLSSKKFNNRPSIYALIALMCFHSSRLQARVGETDEVLLFDQQDRSRWDYNLIKKGKRYLNLSARGNFVGKYHLEASIAYWHTTDHDNKWENILQLYNRLLTIEYSPVIALNRTYALAMANSIEEAIEQALKLNLNSNHYYFCLLAELYKLDRNVEKEVEYLHLALKHVQKINERQLILNKLDKTMM